MSPIEQRFAQLGVDNAPGQEQRQAPVDLGSIMRGPKISGAAVDFSHGDVDAFEPPPGAFDDFASGVRLGGSQAYTEYLGREDIREYLADKLSHFTGAPVDGRHGLIITPGSQGALFLALASTVSPGDDVCVVQPDYFANRKIVRFLGGRVAPVALDYLDAAEGAGIDLSALERNFRAGAKVLVFSNPNNPTGAVYSPSEIARIADLAERYGATVIVDQLYARLRYAGIAFTHICAAGRASSNLVTVMGPSKTESLSGYRLGVAFGSHPLIGRMEKLQAIVSLRAAGYNQAVLRSWFNEPAGWMEERIDHHQRIRDALLAKLSEVEGCAVRSPDAGSYLFPHLPDLVISMQDFIRLLRHQADVIVTPGTEFGPHSGQSIRLNFSQDFAKAVDAADRMVEMISRYRR